jgi:hypothetical protein
VVRDWVWPAAHGFADAVSADATASTGGDNE